MKDADFNGVFELETDDGDFLVPMPTRVFDDVIFWEISDGSWISYRSDPEIWVLWPSTFLSSFIVTGSDARRALRIAESRGLVD